MKFQHFGCIANESKEKATLIIKEVEKNVKKYFPKSTFTFIKTKKDEFENIIINTIPSQIDCIIVLGGDGTVVNASKTIVQQCNAPILGIHIGTLGFLLDVNESNMIEAFKSMANQDFMIDKRSMIHVVMNDYEDIALNDLVIGREGFSRVISVDVYTGNNELGFEFIANYKGDGILVSTPTGSTSYNLSLNGPILHPNSPVFVITPIAAHSLTGNKSIIIPDTDIIKCVIKETKKTQEKEALISCDGRTYLNLKAGDEILIKKSNFNTNFIRFSDYGFFKNLTKKL